MDLWIENTADKVLYNVNGTSIFKQNEKILALESNLYSFKKEYGSVALADAGYTSFKNAITTAGGTIIAP